MPVTLPSFVIGYAKWFTACCYLKIAVQNIDPPMQPETALWTFTAGGMEWTVYDVGPLDGTTVTAKATGALGTVLVGAQVRFPQANPDPGAAQRVVEAVARTIVHVHAA